MKRDPQPARPPAGGRGGLRPWHLLVLGVLAAGVAALVVTRGSGVVNMVLVPVAVATGGLVAAGAFRSLAPLVADEAVEQPEMVAGRTRAALEREKMLALRSIKEVEFDRAMGKISDEDFREMAGRLRTRAASLMRQLDGGGYRQIIERDLTALRGGKPRPASPEPEAAPAAAGETAPGTCAACGVANDADARFCKSCGSRLGGVS